ADPLPTPLLEVTPTSSFLYSSTSTMKSRPSSTSAQCLELPEVTSLKVPIWRSLLSGMLALVPR
ncbi:unnamed protein product, partial [Pylaiella littoralis]